MSITLKSAGADAKSLAYSSSPTLAEFVDDPDIRYGSLVRKRLAEVKLAAGDQDFFVTYPDIVHFAVLATPDDPDTVAVLPVVATIVASSPRFDLRVVRDDADLSLFDLLVDDINLVDELDDLDLPQLFLFDADWQVQEQWGPRPAGADRRLDQWLERHSEYERLADSDDDGDQEAYQDLLDRLVHEMRTWYNSHLNQACIDEIRQLLAGLQSDSETGDE